MFVNYFADEERSSPVNLAVGRTILTVWLVWKTAMYDWNEFFEVPFFLTPEFTWAVPPVAPGLFMTVEKWVLIGLLVLFAVGYRIRLTGGLSALLLAHFGTVREIQNNSGESQALFLGVYFLVFYSLFSGTHALSVDGLRRTRDWSVDSLRSFIVSGRDSYQLPALKWSLLVIAMIYFGSGVNKLFPNGPFGGFHAGYLGSVTLSRIIVVRDAFYQWHVPIGPALVEYPALITAGSIGTLVVEMGLLVAVLLGVTVTPFIIGLLGFQTGVLVLLGIFFVDTYPLLLTFFAWDRVYERVVSDRDLDVVFDGQCYFCMRSLYLFKMLDVNGTVRFIPQAEAPDAYRQRGDVDFQSAMYAFDGTTAYAGYDAFRELLRQFRVFFPLVYLMGLAPVARVGTRVYRYVAANRGTQFSCQVESDD
ncbi:MULTISPECIES: thiol-disulfide oxidoreductase DCC family protein [Haloarcula]|uniref:thiol-disulfide oxidoreductase DCC family protein n=1 Tax=Haloarcula TaxID=2237 RepID=UPI0023ED0B34|nr:DUF393 domain-containing protein [Halomicroarcula sp. XH51]